MLAYHAQLNSTDDETRLRAARAWTKWEFQTSKLYVDPAHVAEAEKDDFAKYAISPRSALSASDTHRACSAFARIENHYFINDVRLIALWSVRLLLSIHSYIL